MISRLITLTRSTWSIPKSVSLWKHSCPRSSRNSFVRPVLELHRLKASLEIWTRVMMSEKLWMPSIISLWLLQLFHRRLDNRGANRCMMWATFPRINRWVCLTTNKNGLKNQKFLFQSTSKHQSSLRRIKFTMIALSKSTWPSWFPPISRPVISMTGISKTARQKSMWLLSLLTLTFLSPSHRWEPNTGSMW